MYGKCIKALLFFLQGTASSIIQQCFLRSDGRIFLRYDYVPQPVRTLMIVLYCLNIFVPFLVDIAQLKLLFMKQSE
jgi:hypothetical protein